MEQREGAGESRTSPDAPTIDGRGQPATTDQRRAALTSAIEAEESTLKRLEADQVATKRRLSSLRSELLAIASPPATDWKRSPRSPLATRPRSPAEKVRLFRDLFRGRLDVFTTRFVSRKTGKAGYAPACANKFVPGVCELPKVKCAACTRHAFTPVDDAAIVAHLRGQHVMGVYPMLSDETCWFLAVDFDKGGWMEDVRDFAKTARRLGLHPAVERSRSGNGAHVWFFFSAPVAASIARVIGCHLITETMAGRHELSMDSYDRLFPSQDTMPRGGFGNLIALPLQHGPRQEGNSVFLDEDLVAYPGDEQWSFLASVKRIDPAMAERIAADAIRTGSVVGVRAAEAADEANAEPWTRLPSRTPRPLRLDEPLPKRISGVLAQRLFINKEGLPSPLINAVKRLAAFQNPEFYKKQRMRLSTALTPRVITCAEDMARHVALLRIPARREHPFRPARERSFRRGLNTHSGPG